MDFHILVTTKYIEDKGISDRIIQVCGLKSGQFTKVEVIEDSLTDIKNKLDALKLNESDKYIINLTGGTKIMSIGVNRYFEDFDHESYYITIGKNTYKRIFPKDNDKEYPLFYSLDLSSYLSAYGFNIIRAGLPNWVTLSLSNAFYTKFHNLSPSHFAVLLLKELRKWQQRNSNTHLQLTSLPTELTDFGRLLSFLNFTPQAVGQVSADEIQFIISGWWEAFVYFRLKKDLNLLDDAIAANCHIERKGVTNELDIVFVKNNKLFVVECKTGFEKFRFTDAFNEAVYKLAALRKDFGLRIPGYVFILDRNLRENTGNIKSLHAERAKVFETTLIDRIILDDTSSWQNITEKIK